MPLFARRLFYLENPSKKITEQEQQQQHDDATFRIEHTGEVFDDRTLFENVKKIYELERWTCQCTSRSSLTHRDALQSEIETRKSLPTLVPTYFNKTILQLVHHSVKPLDKLAEEISIVLGQSFVLGEAVQFKKRKDSNVIKGIVERIEENDEPRKRTSERASVQNRILSDKQMKNVKYSIRLIDEDRVMNNVQPNELQRSHPIPNREKLKTFIRCYAIRLGNRPDSPWILSDERWKEEYQISDRLDASVIEKAREGMLITVDEILREQDRHQRKQTDEEPSNAIHLSDDEEKKSPKKNKSRTSPSKAKKQLTLDQMKFTKSNKGNSNEELLEKCQTSSKTYTVAVPYSLLQKLDKTRRDRGIESKLFQRLVLHCARTLNEKQRQRLPDEYRSLIQSKYDELELKRRLSEMTEEEKKSFLQTKQKEKKKFLGDKTIEDLDLSASKTLPIPKPFEAPSNIPSHSIADLLYLCTFFTSCQSLFFFSLADHLSKDAQTFLRQFRHEFLLQAFSSSSSKEFFPYFIELLQILMKFFFKEDETTTNDDDEPSNEIETNFDDRTLATVHSDDLEQIYEVKLIDIPLTPFTCAELTRLFFIKSKDETVRRILQRFQHFECQQFSLIEQLELLLFLVNLITTNNEVMSEYFENLTRTMTETYRERNLLLSERRKAQEEESQQKKLQLQNGENGKTSTKKSTTLLTTKNSSGTTNDENHQTTPISADEHGENDEEDLKSVLQRRRQMLAISKELKEKKELENHKALIEEKRDLAIEKAEQAYQEALLNLQFGFRIKPLGYDRYYNRYWFFKGHAGLFVEKGWIGGEIHYSTQTNSSPRSTINGEKLLPKDEENQWWIYDSLTSIEQLTSALNDRGIRESTLRENLKKISPLLHSEFERMSKKEENGSLIHSNSFDIIGAFKTDLEDIETRLRHGSLGGFLLPDQLDEWLKKVKESSERTDLADLLIQLQETVAEKYASGIFGTNENQSKRRKTTSKKKSTGAKSSSQRAQHLQIWMNDCRTCSTYSRLYVLMLIFENSIAWNKSARGLKCKVCRRKNKEDFIVVCDQCCQGYHPECLRAYAHEDLKRNHHDLWFCPVCLPQPISKRRAQRGKNEFYDAEIYEMDVDNQSHEDFDESVSVQSDRTPPIDEEEEEENDEELHCCICAGETSMENELIRCHQCRQSYHCQCHEPPLRCPPRSTTWMCSHCRNGLHNETTRRSSTRRSQPSKKNFQRKDRIQPSRSARKNYRESDDEEDEEIDDEFQVKSTRRSKRLRETSSDESEEEEELFHRTRRRVRISESSEDEEESDILHDENIQIISS